MRREAEQLIQELETGRISRRDFLRRAALFGVGIASTSSLLAACGAPSQTAAPTAGSGGSGGGLSGSLELWSRETFDNGARQPRVLEHLKQFEAANPGVTTTAQFMIFQESVQKTQAALAAGTAPDVGQQGPDVALSFAAGGHLLPLDDVYESIGKDRFIQLEREAYVEHNGSTYALPWYSETRVLFYHKDLLEQAGLQPPTTWEELSAAATALTSGERFGFIYGLEGPAPGQFWIPLGVSAGGLVLNEEGKVTINSEPFREALAFAASFVKNGSMPEAALTYKNAEAIKLFQLKQAAMTYGNAQILVDIEGIDPALAENIGAVTVPVKNPGDTPRSFLGGFHLFVFAQSESPEAAKALVKYMYEDPWYTDYMQQTKGAALPVLKSAISSPFYQEDPILSVLIEQQQTAVRYAGPVYGNTPYMGQAEGQLLFAKPLTDVMAGKADVDSALAELERSLNELAGQS